MSEEYLPDRESYERVWEAIKQIVEQYRKQHPEIRANIRNDAKESIWNEYVKFNRKCRESYMKEGLDRLDRHKVCSCYIFAIIKAGLFDGNSSDGEKRLLLDEKIALTLGFSLHREFIVAAIDESEYSPIEKKNLKDKVAEGIKLPSTNHGKYRENFEIELYYTKLENNYNILSLANTLYLLETLTLETDAICSAKKSFIRKLFG